MKQIVFSVLLVYLLIGISIVAFGPAKREISNAVDESRSSSLVNAMLGRSDPPKWKLIAYRLVLSLAFILLWPVFISELLKQKSAHNKARRSEDSLMDEGIRFQTMGGYGKVSCRQCDYSEAITSFLHGVDSHSTGYQCRTCGKFTPRTYKQPFADSHGDEPLSELAPKYRARRIEFLQSMISLCETQMQGRPKRHWLPTWEPTVTTYRKELSAVPPSELAEVKRIRDASNAAYEASRFCECGGPLDREETLFCPKCRSTDLSYAMEFIT